MPDLSKNPDNDQLEISQPTEPNRRKFLRDAAAIAAAGATAAGAEAATSAEAPANDKFQPKEYYRERMQAPNDGKKLAWFVDTRRCFGCHACEVSCKAENDVPLGEFYSSDFLSRHWRVPPSRPHVYAYGMSTLRRRSLH